MSFGGKKLCVYSSSTTVFFERSSQLFCVCIRYVGRIRSGRITSIAVFCVLTRTYLYVGCILKVVGVAPLGDPFELAVRGYHLTLRRDEVSVVKVRQIGKAEVR